MAYEIAATNNFNEAYEVAKLISQTEFAGKYKGKPADVFVAVQFGQEVGLKPLQALQNIAVINGKPSIYGDAALAIAMNDQAFVSISEEIAGEGDQMTAICVVKTKAKAEMETIGKFSVVDAKKAQLWGKAGPWTQYPKRMLQMRARGFALRDALPNALKGMITREEAEDFPAEPKDITPKKQKQIKEEPAKQEPVIETIEQQAEQPKQPELQITKEQIDARYYQMIEVLRTKETTEELQKSVNAYVKECRTNKYGQSFEDAILEEARAVKETLTTPAIACPPLPEAPHIPMGEAA